MLLGELPDRVLQAVRDGALSCWSATRATRERMVQHPRLFLQALTAGEQQRDLEQLRAGPEGQCLGSATPARVHSTRACAGYAHLTPELLEGLRAVSTQIRGGRHPYFNPKYNAARLVRPFDVQWNSPSWR